jgi:hypothetical protein
MRFRNIEFRWSTFNNKYELVSWHKDFQIKETGTYEQKEICYVIAFFDKDKEGYDMRTVGDRFFENKDAWVVGKYALGFLNEIFDIEQDEEELK